MYTRKLLFFFVFLCISNSALSFDLKASLMLDFQRISELSGIDRITLTIDSSSSGRTRSSGDNSVIVSLVQTENLLREVDKKHRTTVMRAVLGHELAHQLQSRWLNYTNITQLNECQADIISGFLTMLIECDDLINYVRTSNISMEMETYNEALMRMNDKLSSALTVFFDLGENYTSHSDTHPRSEQRRTAMREGMYWGILWLLDLLEKDTDIPLEYRRHYKSEISKFKQLLAYIPGDNLMSWSERHSKKIIHFDIRHCRDLIVKDSVSWDISSENPFVAYYSEISNKGNNILTVNFSVRTVKVKRSDPNNSLFWTLTSSSNHSITLKPNEKKMVFNKLQWDASADMMPRILTLSDPNTLYAISTTNSTVKLDELANSYSTSKVNSELVISMSEMFNTSRNSIEEYVGGLGVYNWYSNKIVYPSVFGTNEDVKCNVIYSFESKNYYFDVAIYFEDLSNLLELLDKLKGSLNDDGIEMKIKNFGESVKGIADIYYRGKQIGQIIQTEKTSLSISMWGV